MLIIILGVALLVGAGVLLLVRRSQQRKLFQIKATRPTTIRELADLADSVNRELQSLGQPPGFSQMAAVKGNVKCDAPLISEVARQPCVYYAMSVSRDYEETYYETDSQTKRQVAKTRRSSDTVASNSQRVDFRVEDGTGRLRVAPDGAAVDAVQVVDRYEPGEQGLTGGVISIGGFSISVGGFSTGPGRRTLGYRFRESTLPLDRRVYVLGEAASTSGELTMQKPREKDKQFIISLKSEEDLARSVENTVRWLLVGAIASGVAGVAAVVGGMLR